MRENTLRIFLIISLIVVTVTAAATGTASPMPVISMGPPTSTAKVGETFTVDVNVADIVSEESLYGWEFRINFNTTILQAVNVSEGPFLKTAGTTSWELMPPKIDNYRGNVSVADGLFPYPNIGVVGSGTLANVTFRVKAEGRTTLHFYKTQLFTYHGTIPPPLIDHVAEDGFFAYPLSRDIAVTDVTASPTSVRAGETVSINVTVKNEGEVEETFDVTVLYDSTEIETKTVTDLATEDVETLSFSWNTKDRAEGNYTITAVASEIGGETDTADNTYTNVVVTVTAPLSAFPTQFFIAVIIIAVAIMCTMGLFYLRRRRPTKP